MNFEIIFTKMDEVLQSEQNAEFRVSFAEAPPEERDSINELRKLVSVVTSSSSTSFITS